MEVTSILLARVLAFFEIEELRPAQDFFFPDVVKKLVHECSFQKFPVTLDDWRSEKGAIFEVGKWGKTVVERLVLYHNGVHVETRISSSESMRVLKEFLAWTKDELGSRYDPPMKMEMAYVSGFVFRSDIPLFYGSPVEKLSQRMSGVMSEILGAETIYQPTMLNIGHDPLLRKYGRAQFTLQRRAEVPFTENKYFTESPLPTDVHISLMEQYEEDVAATLNLPSRVGRSVQRLG